MFIDEVFLELQAGRGGNGMMSFRHEKYVEFGGPFGGSGGNGGSIIFVGDSGKNTLYDLKYNHHIKAQNGENGKSKGMHGKNGENTYVHVPLGTQVYTIEGVFIGELKNHNEELLVAEGGKGGRGNMSFASHKNPAPDFAENGDVGEELKVRVELKVLADVGLIGYPSVGKSTLISVLSNARPKIAAYPFTTLSPILGVLQFHDRSLVVADLPGLIKNASLGYGLGFRFLRHIERCRLFVHVIDGLRDNPYQDFLDINEELNIYDEKLLERPQVVVINKIDSIEPKQMGLLEKKFKDLNPIFISGITKTNITELVQRIFSIYDTTETIDATKTVVKYYKKEETEEPFTIKISNNIFFVTGNTVKKYFERMNTDNYSSVMRFLRVIQGLGVNESLKNIGAKNGDIINIFDFEFEFIDD